MADRNTSIVTGDNLLMVYFQRRLIKSLHEQVWFYQLAEKFPLPQGSGNQMTFNGWRKLGAASSTLAEASSNSAVNLSSRKVNVTVVSYGRHVKITDLLELTSIAPPIEGAMRELSHAAALTLDNAVQRAIFKNVLAQVGQNADTKTKILSLYMSAVASAFCADTGTIANVNQQFGFPAIFGTSAARLSAVSATAPSISARLGPIAFRKGVARLTRLAAQPFGDGKWVAVAHPNALATMYGNSDWKQWQLNYSGGPTSTMYKNEAGQVHNVRILVSPNCPRFAVAAHSVNLTPILGEGAVGVTELGGGVEMILKRPGPDTVSEPYNLNSTLAFKLRVVAATLNPSAGCILFTSEMV